MRFLILAAGVLAVFAAGAERRTVGDVVVTVTRHGPGTLHVTKVPKGRALAKSYAVPALPAETDGGIRHSCDAEGALTFYGDDGQVLLREKESEALAVRWYNDFADAWIRSGRPPVTTPHAALLPCE